jgi:TRAP-type mannitol/chloroaromatic compound transport system permease small subunit
MNSWIRVIDRVSAFTGKTFSWTIGALMIVVCLEVAKRYLFNTPSAWVFDITSMMYGVTFMMCGAYALAQNAHVRGDFLYGSMQPRTQAALDLALYFFFFIPGILAMCLAGWQFAADSWVIREHSSITAEGPPVYQFKAVIPLAGALVLLQGMAEIARCIICLKTGEWPARLEDAEEIDVVEQQLSDSQYVDEDVRRETLARVHEIDDAAHARGKGELRAVEEYAARGGSER